MKVKTLFIVIIITVIIYAIYQENINNQDRASRKTLEGSMIGYTYNVVVKDLKILDQVAYVWDKKIWMILYRKI